MFWSRKKQYYLKGVEHNPPRVVIRGGMDNKRLFRPYFCDGFVNEHTYLDMPENCFMSQLEVLCTDDNAPFQLDEAPTYNALAVKEYMSDVSQAHWTGRGSPVLSAQLDRRHRSSDL